MKSKSNIGIGTGTAFSIFAVAIMISSATAVPLVNDEFSPVTQPLSSDRWNTDEILDAIDEYILGDDSFEEKFLNLKTDLVNELEEISPELLPEMRSFFNIEETFGRSSLINRINIIREYGVIEGLKKILGTVDTYEEFCEFFEGKVGKLLELGYDPESETYEFPSQFYPFVEITCIFIQFFSAFWTIPLQLALGVLGLIIACAITAIIFGVLIAPMVLYVATMEAIKNDNELHDDLIELIENGGYNALLLLGPPLILLSVFKGPWFSDALKYILDQTLVWQFDRNSGTLHTREVNPVPRAVPLCVPRANVGDRVQFTAKVYDDDIVEVKDGETSEYMTRDAVQVGWDWNGDDLVDEWTDYYDIPDDKDEMMIVTYHRFTKVGTYYVKHKTRDHWGVEDTWSGVTKIEIKELDRHRDINLLYYIQTLINNFFERIQELFKTPITV